MRTVDELLGAALSQRLDVLETGSPAASSCLFECSPEEWRAMQSGLWDSLSPEFLDQSRERICGMRIVVARTGAAKTRAIGREDSLMGAVMTEPLPTG